MKIQGYIYKLVLNKDLESFKRGEIYIGKHNGIKKEYFGSGKLIKSIISKYGLEVFDREIIAKDIDTNELLCYLEIYYISHYKCNRSKYNIGLNLTDGGEGIFGYKKTKEAINNMRESILQSYSTGKRVAPKKRVYQYNLDGSFVTSYESAVEASLIVNKLPSSINYACRGECQTVAGFYWSYEQKDYHITPRSQNKRKYEFKNK